MANLQERLTKTVPEEAQTIGFTRQTLCIKYFKYALRSKGNHG